MAPLLNEKSFPQNGDCLPAANPSQDMLDILAKRRSTPIKMMGWPGPDKQTLDNILKIAARVPDHRKLEPWRFIVIQEDVASELGHRLSDVHKRDNPDVTDAELDDDKALFMRAPVCVAVVSSPDVTHKTPVWEQELSAGAVCMNMLLAANAHGYAGAWLTEWYSFSENAKTIFGLSAHERFAGFIYLGSSNQDIPERPRPELKNKVLYWGQDVS